jgi:hypothetical protein
MQASTSDITKSANEQYVAIIAGVRSKRASRLLSMPNTASMANLSMNQTVPFKFRVKFGHNSDSPPRSSPTRSRSVAQGLTLPDKTPNRIRPGQIASLTQRIDFPPMPCRVLGVKSIRGIPHALVAFFQREFQPCYVQLSQLGPLPERPKPPDPDLSVDFLLDRWIRDSYVMLLEIQPLTLPATSTVFQRAFVSAVELLLLAFASNFKAPTEKLSLMLDTIVGIHPPKFTSTQIVDERAKEMIRNILKSLDS